MKYSAIILVLVVLFCAMNSALATPDSLACRMIDWLDVEGTTCHFGSSGTGEYSYWGTYLWDMAMGNSFLVWLPGTRCLWHIRNPIASKPEAFAISAYPNPFNSSCKTEAEPSCNLEIYDLQGHLIDNGKTDYGGIFCWRPCNLPTGIYLLKINDDIAKAFLMK